MIGLTTVKESYHKDMIYMEIIVDCDEYDGCHIEINSPACIDATEEVRREYGYH